MGSQRLAIGLQPQLKSQLSQCARQLVRGGGHIGTARGEHPRARPEFEGVEAQLERLRPDRAGTFTQPHDARFIDRAQETKRYM